MGAHLFVGQLAEADRKMLLNSNMVKLVRAFFQEKDQTWGRGGSNGGLVNKTILFHNFLNSVLKLDIFKTASF